jgi:hypothetical protein
MLDNLILFAIPLLQLDADVENLLRNEQLVLIVLVMVSHVL